MLKVLAGQDRVKHICDKCGFIRIANMPRSRRPQLFPFWRWVTQGKVKLLCPFCAADNEEM